MMLFSRHILCSCLASFISAVAINHNGFPIVRSSLNSLKHSPGDMNILKKSTLSTHDATVSLNGSATPISPTGGGTYPRANRLSDGSIIGAYTSLKDGNYTINLVRSTDDGSTWTALGTAASGPKDANSI